MDLKGKKVAVVGLGRSGLAACNLLIEKGARVSITDCLDSQEVRENLHSLDKKHIIDIEIGRHTEDFIRDRDLIVVSPGVALNSAPVRWAKKRDIPVIAEIELAYNFCPALIIAITGTNGKTTVSSLVAEILRKAQRNCAVCGNIGTPFSAVVGRVTKECTVVLEVSSFQLETIARFRPKIAVILNLQIDHLDRYANLQEYIAAKCRIFSNQTAEDWSIINSEDPLKAMFAEKTKARVLYFSQNYLRATLQELLTYRKAHDDYLDFDLGQLNNNHFAAITVTSLLDIPLRMAIDICRHFKGIEHRMEEVAKINGVIFINDSKATNVGSTIWALDSINKPIVLIAGGRDKGCDFSVLKEKIKDKVKAIILFGEAKEKIEKALEGLVLTEKAKTLTQAVTNAFKLVQSGDYILFSPMCASFDMFNNYAERGNSFKQIVGKLVHSYQHRVHI